MLVSVLAQQEEGERRVALDPDGVEKLVAAGHRVVVEVGVGEGARFSDNRYEIAGALVAPKAELLAAGGVIVSITGPRHGLGPDHVAIGLYDPLWRPSVAAELAATGATILSLDLIPRITRAQSMDVLSSMATVAGNEAVLLAAARLPKMLPLMMTAAGTIPAARVLVLGAGVAGLQAIATARRLGAIVEGYDVRPAAAEQIRSLGARALELEVAVGETEDEGGYATRQSDDVAARQQELLAEHVADADILITTASIPGAASPRLVTREMVDGMSPGSVIVDLAAERGGNCELTVADVEVDHAGVSILGPTRLTSASAQTASRLFSNNLVALLRHLAPETDLVLDIDDEITAGVLVARKGEVVHPRVTEAMATAS